MRFLYITERSFILNDTIYPASHSSPMETSACLVFGKICACISVLGSIDKYDSPSMVDMIICPLGHFSLIIFVVGCTLFRWEDTAIEFPVHLESATTEFYSFFSCDFFVLGARAILIHTYIFSRSL